MRPQHHRAQQGGPGSKHRHAAGIQAQDLVVEAVEPRLALGDELRLETAGTVTRNRNLDLAVLRQDRLAAAPVTAIAVPRPTGSPLS